MEGDLKHVHFEKYCTKCKFYSISQNPSKQNDDTTSYVDYCDECHECLNTPAMPDSHKPLMFKERDEVK